MRLLKVSPGGRFVLTKFTNRIPPYAILSHTWGQGEVTFNDMINGTGLNKPGYAKIRFCADQALKDELNYCWVDTCCIDKSTSEELNTAINSMYQWYQNAAKCYVHLSDVSVPDEVSDAQSHQMMWEPGFRKSRWFTRGWTLQELLAPPTVEFFSSTYKRLGDKRTLEKEIVEIAGTPVEAIRGTPLSAFDVRTRMAWSSKRETTVPEDKVYCLLGIFGVYMPLIYGEGEQHAATRLQEEIEKAAKRKDRKDAQEVIDVAPSFPTSRLLIPNHNVERQELMHQLDTLLSTPSSDPGSPTPVLLYGLPGTGKTQLARQFAKNWCRENRYFYFLDASSIDSLEQGFAGFAMEAGLADNASMGASPKLMVRKAMQYFSNLTAPWLLIFDNFDLADYERYNLRDYFPEGSNGRIIITSRNRESVEETGGTLLHVEMMTECDAVQLLEKSAGLGDSTNESEEGDQNLKSLKIDVATNLLGLLPLAIAQAGAYIRHRIKRSRASDRLKEYHRQFQIHQQRLLDAEGGLIVRQYGSSVLTSLKLSFDTLAIDNPIAAELLLFFGLFHHSKIPRSFFEIVHGQKANLKEHDNVDLSNPAYSWIDVVLADDSDGNWDSSAFDNALGLLESYSLISGLTEVSWNLHPLVHTWTRISRVNTAVSLRARAYISLCMFAKIHKRDIVMLSESGKVYYSQHLAHAISCFQFCRQHTNLLEPMEETPLQAITLLRLSKIADLREMAPEIKAANLKLFYTLMALISGARNQGLDNISTLQSLRDLLIGIRNIYLDVSLHLAHVFPGLLPIAAAQDSSVDMVEQELSGHWAKLACSETTQNTQAYLAALFKFLDDHHNQLGVKETLRARIIASQLQSSLLALEKNEAVNELYLQAVKLAAEAEAILDADERHYIVMSKCSVANILRKQQKNEEALAILQPLWQHVISSQVVNVQSCTTILHSMNLCLLHLNRYAEIEESTKFASRWIGSDQGPYHIETLLEVRHSLENERRSQRIIPLSDPNIFGTHHGLELDSYITTVLELSIAFKAFRTTTEVNKLWDGAYKQLLDQERADELLPLIPFALREASKAGTRQGYRYYALCLQKQADNLEKLQKESSNGQREKRSKELQRLKEIWHVLDDLHETFRASGAEQAQSKARILPTLVTNAPKKARHEILFLINHYLQLLLQSELATTASPADSVVMKAIYDLTSTEFGPWIDSNNTALAYRHLALVYRLEGNESNALEIEDSLVQRRISEELGEVRFVPGRGNVELRPCTIGMERLHVEYKRRKWYEASIRLYETALGAFYGNLGLEEVTVMQLQFVCELYDRLGLSDHLEQLLNDLQRDFDKSETEQQVAFINAAFSMSRWCSMKEAFEATYQIVHWIARNGWPMSGLNWKISILKDRELVAEKTGRLSEAVECRELREQLEKDQEQQ